MHGIFDSNSVRIILVPFWMQVGCPKIVMRICATSIPNRAHMCGFSSQLLDNHPQVRKQSCDYFSGGSVQIVVDIDAITDASDTNPDLQVVDSFTVQLLTVEELVNISDRCTVEVGLTSVGHLQIVFKSLLEDAEFCFDASKVCVDLWTIP